MTVTFAKLGKYGRRGNGMFQIAATIGLAKRMETDFKFPLWEHKDEFNLPDSCWGLPHISQQYEEACYAYDELPPLKHVNLHGYFQSWKYFDHCEDYVREVFTLQEESDYETFKDTCSIHVRRTDYLKFADSHTNLGIDYYKEAMKKVPSSRFIVISDDVGWCKENFAGDSRVTVSDAAPAEIDFKVLQSCSDHIVANSSFSWWAAWLNPSSDKVVVAPKKWFGPKLAPTHPIDGLIPPDWILI